MIIICIIFVSMIIISLISVGMHEHHAINSEKERTPPRMKITPGTASMWAFHQSWPVLFMEEFSLYDIVSRPNSQSAA